MVALWIILGILAAVGALVAVALVLPVDVLFLLDEEQGFAIRYRFLGKKYGEESNPKSPIVRGLKRTLGLSHLESVKTIRGAVEHHGAAVTLRETMATFADLIEQVFAILKRCRIARCKAIFIAGGEDAPLDYGIACAVIYPLVSYFETMRQLSPRAEEIRIECDYDRPESGMELELAVRIHLGHVLRAFMKIVKKNVEKELSEEGYGK